MTLPAHDSARDNQKKAGDALKTIVARFGSDVWRDSSRLQGLLNDHLGSGKCVREVNVLLGAVSCSVPAELLKHHADMPTELLEGKLAAKLEHDLATQPDAARWAVRAWIVALSIPRKEAEPKQVTPGANKAVAKPTQAAAPQPVPAAAKPQPAVSRLKWVALVGALVVVVGAVYWANQPEDKKLARTEYSTRPGASASATPVLPRASATELTKPPRDPSAERAEFNRRLGEIEARLEQAKKLPGELRADAARARSELSAVEQEFARAQTAGNKPEIERVRLQLETAEAKDIRAEELLSLWQKQPGYGSSSGHDAWLAQISEQLNSARQAAASGRATEATTKLDLARQSIDAPIKWHAASQQHLHNAAAVYRQRGKDADSKKEYTDAIRYFSKVIALEPNNPEDYSSRGWVYYMTDGKVAAIRDLSKAIELTPNDDSVYWKRGVFHEALGDYDAALRDFSKAIELDLHDTTNYLYRANVYSSKKNYDAAIRDWSKYIDLQPTAAFAYRNRGDAFSGKQDYEAAIREYDKALELDPADKYAPANRADARKRLAERK